MSVFLVYEVALPRKELRSVYEQRWLDSRVDPQSPPLRAVWPIETWVLVRRDGTRVQWLEWREKPVDRCQ